MSDRFAELTVARVDDVGMVTLRGDLGAPTIRTALEAVAGLGVPDRLCIAQGLEGRGLGWMSPDEALLLLPLDAAAAAVARLRGDLAGEFATVADVSDARAMFRLAGPDGAVRAALAKLCPVDMAPEALPVGTLRRTRAAQVAAALWLQAPGEARLVCFRSVADYVAGLLGTAARAGSDPGVFRA